ncbi:sensor histidine kinase [Paenibacillus albicereus]|uniref:Sensor histidine kinase n=2 Tax=Paenibacillus albicereus TaxID=2726185 RepID=A0A6H2H3V9_9BACL|nr:sensor histidine kinase [Paenibacillus albicereus]
MYLLDKPLERVIEQKIGESNEDALSLVTFNVRLLLDDMVQASVEMTLHADIRAMLKEPGRYSRFERLRLSDAAFNRVFSSYFSNTEVTLVDRAGGWLSTSYVSEPAIRAYIGSDWYVELMSRPYQQQWMAADSRMLYLEPRRLVTLVKTINDFPAGDNLGTVTFSVPETDVRKMLRGLDGTVYLVDRDGQVVSSSSGARLGEAAPEEIALARIHQTGQGQRIIEKDGAKWIVSHDTVGTNGWKTVQIVPYDKVFEEISAIRRTNVIALVAIVLVFVLVSLTIASGMSRPLRLLRRKMADLERKQFHSTLQVAGPEEIASLIGTYNEMVREIRELLQRVKQEYRQKEEMRFRALQAQINPHFLLNTVNNIKWMAYLRQDNEVGDMLSSLGGILEGSIGRDGRLSTLGQELEYIRSYVSLMRMSAGDVRLDIDVPEALLEQEALQMMLQPIVENALLHGLADRPGAGSVRIEARARDGAVAVTVRDDGSGIGPERLEALRRSLSGEAAGEPSGRIGVKNVHDRLRLQYGEPYGLEVESREGAGTAVSCLLPERRRGSPDGGEG